jgi:predicted MFS family arabinose efflux permease
VTLLLMLAYTLNSADRQLIAIIAQPLKIDLAISDTQLGLLVGAAFAALYALSGLPLARLAERVSRVNILAVVMVLWSGLTALCGTAVRFPQLLLMRMGVGVAEAGCTPAAHSILGDYFPPRQRATALSIYSCGISLGYIVSAVLGGYLALHYSWRAACAVLGVAGVLLALGLKLLVPEPTRASLAERATLAHELRELVAVARVLFTRWPLVNIVLGLTIGAFAAQGSWAFIPAFFNRAYGLDYASVGVLAALTGGVAVGLGLAAGGPLADALGRRSVCWYAYLPALGLGIAAPVLVLAFLQRDWRVSAVLLGVGGLFQYLSFGPTLGVIQNVVGPRQRATASALVYAMLNVVALGGGALFTGWLIDRFAAADFPRLSAVSPTFAAACPGGQPLEPGLRLPCRATLAQASREGIVTTVLLYVWAALHYALAARGIKEALGSQMRRQ